MFGKILPILIWYGESKYSYLIQEYTITLHEVFCHIVIFRIKKIVI